MYPTDKDTTRIIEIACGAAGGVALLLVVVIIICCCYARRRRRRRGQSGDFIDHHTSHKGYQPLQMDQLAKKSKSKRKKEKCKYLYVP